MTLRRKLSLMKAKKNMTTEALSALSGVPRGTLNKLLNGQTQNPTVGTLKALSRALGCPLSWLSGTEEGADPAAIPGVRKGAAIPAGGLLNGDDLMPLREKRVPLLGAIAAGEPITALPADQTAACDASLPGDFALRVRGDSMVGARIRDGDIVYIHSQPDVADGEIAAVVVGDEATLKRVYHVEGGVQLLSENPKYPPMLFTLADVGSIRILGRAVGVLTRL